MDITKKFELMGARAVVRPPRSNRLRESAGHFAIDIRHDRKKGSYFDIELNEADGLSVEVLDVDKKDRHLLLMVKDTIDMPVAKDPTGKRTRPQTMKDKFLCGHDERDWFVARISDPSVSSVLTAKESLKPITVRRSQQKNGVKTKNINRRKNAGYIRQGEWFFVPAEGFSDKGEIIHKNEPIVRGGGGKPHMCEKLIRFGGETVRVCTQYPNGVSEATYQSIIRNNNEASKWMWTTRTRNAVVYVAGKVTHPDHATVNLKGWYEVVPNTEANRNSRFGRSQMVFLD